MSNGKLIVIEGASDGIGKTTQLNLLAERLKQKNYNIKTHHFPSYGTPQSYLIEKHLNGDFGKLEVVNPYFINTIFAVDRTVTWENELRKSYENGDIIILDRYTQSSLIYQGALIENIEKRKEFINKILSYEYNDLKIKKPDIVIFLSAPYSVIEEFKNNRNVKKDYYEQNDAYLKKVYDNANFVAKYLNWEVINYMDNNRLKSIEEINNEIIKILEEKLGI